MLPLFDFDHLALHEQPRHHPILSIHHSRKYGDPILEVHSGCFDAQPCLVVMKFQVESSYKCLIGL